MKTKVLIEDIDDAIYKLKLRLIYLETENKKLTQKIEELKKYVKQK